MTGTEWYVIGNGSRFVVSGRPLHDASRHARPSFESTERTARESTAEGDRLVHRIATYHVPPTTYHRAGGAP
jgi:hypothetical protein